MSNNDLKRIMQLAGMLTESTQLNEGTSGIVGIQRSDNTVDLIRVNWDAYPEGLGATLQKYWTDENAINQVIDQGEARSIGNDINNSEFYRDGHSPTQRGVTDLEQAASDNSAEYVYVFSNGKWKSARANNANKLLDNPVATENMNSIIDKFRNVTKEPVQEWNNSIDGRIDDRGQVSDQPDGEIVDNSLRRYLDATPMKVTVAEDDHTYEGMLREYKQFKRNKIMTVGESDDPIDTDERPVYTDTTTGKTTRHLPSGIENQKSLAPKTSPFPEARPSAPFTSQRPKPRPAK